MKTRKQLFEKIGKEQEISLYLYGCDVHCETITLIDHCLSLIETSHTCSYEEVQVSPMGIPTQGITHYLYAAQLTGPHHPAQLTDNIQRIDISIS